MDGGEATLNGVLNPGGFEVEACDFEYLTEDQYTANVEAGDQPFQGAASAPCAESAAEIGSGERPVPVHATVAASTPKVTTACASWPPTNTARAKAKRSASVRPHVEAEPRARSATPKSPCGPRSTLRVSRLTTAANTAKAAGDIRPRHVPADARSERRRERGPVRSHRPRRRHRLPLSGSSPKTKPASPPGPTRKLVDAGAPRRRIVPQRRIPHRALGQAARLPSLRARHPGRRPTGSRPAPRTPAPPTAVSTSG